MRLTYHPVGNIGFGFSRGEEDKFSNLGWSEVDLITYSMQGSWPVAILPFARNIGCLPLFSKTLPTQTRGSFWQILLSRGWDFGRQIKIYHHHLYKILDFFTCQLLTAIVISVCISNQQFMLFIFYRYLCPSRSPFGVIFSQLFAKCWDCFRLMISPIFEHMFKSILIVFRIPPNPHFAALA